MTILLFDWVNINKLFYYYSYTIIEFIIFLKTDFYTNNKSQFILMLV